MTADPRVLVGDSRLTLRGLPAAHYHAVVTSPPFYRLRDYQAEGQIGMEETPELYLQHLVETFREVRRALRPDGVLWLNLGDSYVSDGGAAPRGATSARTGEKNAAALQPLDLFGMPFRLAFALQADGWLLRGDVVWAKKNPMPESISGWRWERCRVKVRGGLRGKEPARAAHHGRAQQDHAAGAAHDTFAPSAEWTDCAGCARCEASDGLVLRRAAWRPTRSHEYVFQLVRSPRYFCDAEAVREPHQMRPQRRPTGHKRRRPGPLMAEHTFAGTARAEPQPDGNPAGRNLRDVWHLSTLPSRLKHFAMFPPRLVEPCLRAATSAAGCCSACGAPHVRIVERRDAGGGARRALDGLDASGQQNQTGGPKLAGASYQAWRDANPPRTVGFRPSCRCGAAAVPCRVLDPFGGTGTVAAVAEEMGLDWTICELNPAYAAELPARREEVRRWYARQQRRRIPPAPAPDQLALLQEVA